MGSIEESSCFRFQHTHTYTRSTHREKRGKKPWALQSPSPHKRVIAPTPTNHAFKRNIRVTKEAFLWRKKKLLDSMRKFMNVRLRRWGCVCVCVCVWGGWNRCRSNVTRQGGPRAGRGYSVFLVVYAINLSRSWHIEKGAENLYSTKRCIPLLFLFLSFPPPLYIPSLYLSVPSRYTHTR